MWVELKRVIKDNSAICIFGSEPFSSKLRMGNLKMFKYDWIWYKNTSSNFLQSNFQPLKKHEIISIFSKANVTYSKSKKTMIYFPQMHGKTINKNKGQVAKTALKSWNGRQRDDYPRGTGDQRSAPPGEMGLRPAGQRGRIIYIQAENFRGGRLAQGDLGLKQEMLYKTQSDLRKD